MTPLLTAASRNGARLEQPDHALQFHTAVTEAAITRSRRYIAGIRAYQNHPAQRDPDAAPVIWQQGTTVLRDYRPAGGTPILVIPSLINRFHILDLAPDHSLLRFLACQGLRPLVVDWDKPGETERNFLLSDYVTRLAAILHDVGDRPCHILGYCMGGLLALALAILKPAQTRSLTLMATPWNFPSATPGLGDFRDLAAKLEPHLAAWNELPVSILENLFAALQPMQEMRKFTRFAAMDPDSDEARYFVLTEDWLNDGVPLTANVARECLGGWYGENTTGKMQWRVGDTLIDPRALNIPAYVIVPGKDKIVTPESALPLARLIRGATLHEPMLGHIGLLASRKAPSGVWAPLAGWLRRD